MGSRDGGLSLSSMAFSKADTVDCGRAAPSGVDGEAERSARRRASPPLACASSRIRSSRRASAEAPSTALTHWPVTGVKAPGRRPVDGQMGVAAIGQLQLPVGEVAVQGCSHGPGKEDLPVLDVEPAVDDIGDVERAQLTGSQPVEDEGESAGSPDRIRPRRGRVLPVRQAGRKSVPGRLLLFAVADRARDLVQVSSFHPLPVPTSATSRDRDSCRTRSNEDARCTARAESGAPRGAKFMRQVTIKTPVTVVRRGRDLDLAGWPYEHAAAGPSPPQEL